eukprot:TRINITY_DN22920_c0_g1_i1.p1 TRINITY_DN22920_c0_g1~~TRINITY_DN22920_c0_g1_i1.p1  ORF type:complete len:430 (+),score=103.48 TRINITY_DN22920_c0_g1_i1:48-1337(+)
MDVFVTCTATGASDCVSVKADDRVEDLYTSVGLAHAFKQLSEFVLVYDGHKLDRTEAGRTPVADCGLCAGDTITLEYDEAEHMLKLKGYRRPPDISHSADKLLTRALDAEDYEAAELLHRAGWVDPADALNQRLANLAQIRALVDRCGFLVEGHPWPTSETWCSPLFECVITGTHRASAQPMVDTARYLISVGCCVETPDREMGMTPVMHAVRWPDTEMAEVILAAAREQGVLRAVLSARDHLGVTPLRHAIMSGNNAAVAMLIQQGADVNETAASGGATPLHTALAHGRHQAVEALLTAGADPDPSGGPAYPDTPLLMAVAAGSVDVVQRLITAGADVNRANLSGMSPLRHAARLAKESTVSHTRVVASEICGVLRQNGAGADVQAEAEKVAQAEVATSKAAKRTKRRVRRSRSVTVGAAALRGYCGR